MSKGKYKRKRERAQQNAKEAAQETLLMDTEKIADDKQEPAKKATAKASTDQKPTWWARFAAWTKREKTFTDWCIAVFTLVLAGAAIYQFIIMGRQLDAMRGQLGEMQRETEISERPWLSVEAVPRKDGITFVNGNQAVLVLKLSIKNVGRSIAKNIQIDVKMFPYSVVRGPVTPDAASKQRELCDHVKVTELGLIDLFPSDHPAEREVNISSVPSDIAAQSVPVTSTTSRSFVGFYVVGCVTYHSSFGTELHQTRFAYDLIRGIPPEKGKFPTLRGGMPLILGFEVGVNAPQQEFTMMQELFARNDAN